jgi:hypothetical protein
MPPALVPRVYFEMAHEKQAVVLPTIDAIVHAGLASDLDRARLSSEKRISFYFTKVDVEIKGNAACLNKKTSSSPHQMEKRMLSKLAPLICPIINTRED